MLYIGFADFLIPSSLRLPGDSGFVAQWFSTLASPWKKLNKYCNLGPLSGVLDPVLFHLQEQTVKFSEFCKPVDVTLVAQNQPQREC